MILGQKLWKKAKKLMPGGTMLFSKNPDLFLPKKWPAYYYKAKGCMIWDLEKKKYIDISTMSVGACTLGYANSEIDKEVIKKLKLGNMTSLNNCEEILLAEKLIEMHPWAEMARFARSGGEANAIAIRIARAATSKKKIAVCGYHGWHDWYLSSNLNNSKNLENFLFPNVPIMGVPQDLKNTVFPFQYNNLNELKKLILKHDIGIIKMEVSRDDVPTGNFLKNVRKICDEKKIILIFDECTSGFRKTFGGLHKFFKVSPDMAMFGKALGNGYAVNAIIGKRSIMDSAKSTFISSTFWTERIGTIAALKTLEVMHKNKNWELISKIGKSIKYGWEKIAKDYDIKIIIKGIDALPNFYFPHDDNLYFKTYISQEMLKNKILAGNSVYVCSDHNKNILNKYFNVLDEVFKKIKQCIDEKENIKSLLKSPVCIAGMRSLKNLDEKTK
jgi:glutamate-1-semialdehyde aminotransferase